ncbi:MAG: RNA polymerase sigma factor RpoH [Burkholderiaceae bacterium]
MNDAALMLTPEVLPAPPSTSLRVRDPWGLIAAPIGNLDAYIQTVNRIPLLSAEEETELGRRLQSEQDIEAARRLVISHLRVVTAVARQFLGYGLPHADLIQEGNIGLMKAVKRFDVNRGVRLVSFAMHWIKAEIYEYVMRNWRMVKVATTKAHRKLFFNLNSFRKHGKTLSREQIGDIAQQLNVKPEDVSEMEARMAGGDVSLDPLSTDDSDEAYAPVRYLQAEQAEPSAVLEARQSDHLHGRGLEHALAQLDDRSQRIVQARWLTDGSQAKTLHELAAELNISAERVRQVEQQAMKKMRLLLQSA